MDQAEVLNGPEHMFYLMARFDARAVCLLLGAGGSCTFISRIRMVNQSVHRGHRSALVRTFVPFVKRLIGGNQNGTPFIAH